MKISKIKKLSNGKYKIKFDDMSEITTYDEVILKENLLLNKIVDEKKLEKISNQTEFYSNYNKVLKYVVSKIRSEKEIDEYIKKSNLEDKKEEIKKKLKDINLINDSVYLKSYVYDRVNLSNDGPNQIINNLKEQNITDFDEVYKYMNEFDIKLEKLMKKKIQLNKNKSKNMLKQKLILYFIDLGYDKDKIVYYFNNNFVENKDIVQREYDKLYKKYFSKKTSEELDFFIKSKLYSKGFSKDDISKIKDINILDKNKREINLFLDEYYARYTGLYLKSKDFLKQIN